MKKPILLVLLVLTITACHNSSKFGKIKQGMSSKAVVALVGNPESKTPLFTIEWWNYSKDNKLIVMSNDTVVRVVMDLKATQDSMKSLAK